MDIELKTLLRRALPHKYYLKLRKYALHRKEVVFSLWPSNVEYPDYPPEVDYTIDRWRESRKLIHEWCKTNAHGNFLNAGSGVGDVNKTLFTFSYDEPTYTMEQFFNKFNYYTLEYFDLDLRQVKKGGGRVYFSDTQSYREVSPDLFSSYPDGFHAGHLTGSLIDEKLLDRHSKYIDFFDIIYCSDVMEHLDNPWIGARNLLKLTKVGGYIIVITPFSYPYHPDPDDFYRFTHNGLCRLFECHQEFGTKRILTGYDITNRRDNRKGKSVPNDIFGGWRENWMTICILQRTE